ncbi:unnamed protein product [Arctogadus glacialis]
MALTSQRGGSGLVPRPRPPRTPPGARPSDDLLLDDLRQWRPRLRASPQRLHGDGEYTVGRETPGQTASGPDSPLTALSAASMAPGPRRQMPQGGHLKAFERRGGLPGSGPSGWLHQDTPGQPAPPGLGGAP